MRTGSEQGGQSNGLFPVSTKPFPQPILTNQLWGSRGIHLMAISQEMFKTSITEMYLKITYRKVSNIRRTKSQNLNDSHLVLKSSLPNPLKPGVKSRMKM